MTALDAHSVAELARWLAFRRRLLALTGAGCSTESGIPDYRDLDGAWKRRPPMSFEQFVGSRRARQRYWARSGAGWRRFAASIPNPGHRALAELETTGRLAGLVTQNVDGLHQRAGSGRVVELHGSLDWVECLGCSISFRRADFQRELESRNPRLADLSGPQAPDGDTDLDDSLTDLIEVPDCPACGGVLKPGVVFFGESVPRDRVLRSFQLLGEADGLLVAGSSLMVWSGFRFARRAAELGIPIAIVNLGRTRADELATLKVEVPCGEALPAALASLGVAEQLPSEGPLAPSPSLERDAS